MGVLLRMGGEAAQAEINLLPRSNPRIGTGSTGSLTKKEHQYTAGQLEAE